MGNVGEYRMAKQSNYNILVVEDNSFLRDVIYELLESQDFRVTTATSGEEAIETLNVKCFDLLIMDINLGRVVNGIAVLKKAKEMYPETMTIIMTGALNVNYATEAMKLDASDYLFKPFELKDFLNRVSNCITKLESIRVSKRSRKD